MLRAIRLLPVIFLTILTAACSMSPNRSANDVPRRAGECTDPRFKQAELAAFQAMLQERAAATAAFEREITRIERAYKDALLTKRSQYNQALNTCKDSACSTNAKADYDMYVEREQVSHEAEIQLAEDAEQVAIELAQDRYNQAVDEARKKYCTRAYKADGQIAESTYYGVICSLEAPFTIDVASPYYQFTVQFTPSGPQGGALTYSGVWFDVGTVNADGAYSVTYAGTDATQIALSTAHTTHTIEGDVNKDQQYTFNLLPLDSQECSGP